MFHLRSLEEQQLRFSIVTFFASERTRRAFTPPSQLTLCGETLLYLPISQTARAKKETALSPLALRARVCVVSQCSFGPASPNTQTHDWQTAFTVPMRPSLLPAEEKRQLEAALSDAIGPALAQPPNTDLRLFVARYLLGRCETSSEELSKFDLAHSVAPLDITSPDVMLKVAALRPALQDAVRCAAQQVCVGESLMLLVARHLMRCSSAAVGDDIDVVGLAAGTLRTKGNHTFLEHEWQAPLSDSKGAADNVMLTAHELSNHDLDVLSSADAGSSVSSVGECSTFVCAQSRCGATSRERSHECMEAFTKPTGLFELGARAEALRFDHPSEALAKLTHNHEEAVAAMKAEFNQRMELLQAKLQHEIDALQNTEAQAEECITPYTPFSPDDEALAAALLETSIVCAKPIGCSRS